VPPSTAALLIDDDARLGALVTEYLGRHEIAVTVAVDGERGLGALRRGRFDVVLLDVMLPGSDGFEVCRRLRATPETAALPVIMLTARGDDVDKIVGLELGADDYVVKPFSGPEVIARIRAVLRRTRRDDDGPVRRQLGDLEIDEEARRVFMGEDELDLSRKEFDLLAVLADAAGRVLTRDHLMARVWDENWFGPTKTLDVHIGTLRRKLGDDPANPRYIHTVRGVGFRFATDEELRASA
jgi:two-component system, OmpR family, response regulator RegX3